MAKQRARHTLVRSELPIRAVRSAAEGGAIYEAGATTRRTIGWHAPGATANGLLANLTTIRARSRAAIRNDGVAESIIGTLVSNTIGTGITPLSKAPDKAFRQRVHQLWFQWVRQTDADGLLDFYGQQRQLTRSWLEGGDVFARLRFRLPKDRLVVPLQVQLLEAETCPDTYTATLPNGNRVRAGIEFDGIGRRVAYHFHPSHPADPQDFDRSQLRRVDAVTVMHVFEPLRPGQLRGLPRLTQALVKLHTIDKLDDAVLLRQQLSNLFAGFITKNPTLGGDDMNPLTGLPIGTGDDADGVLNLAPGTFQELDPGEDITFSTPPGAPDSYDAFIRQQLAAACNAAGAPYELVTGDMRGLNDRTLRVLLNEFRRRIQASQHQIIAHQFCEPVYRAFIDQAILSGALTVPADFYVQPELWLGVKWMPAKWPYIHPVQDVQAAAASVREGFASRQGVVAENGEDAEVIDAEQAADNERADALGLTYDSDSRYAKGAAEAPKTSNTDPVDQPEGATA